MKESRANCARVRCLCGFSRCGEWSAIQGDADRGESRIQLSFYASPFWNPSGCLFARDHGSVAPMGRLVPLGECPLILLHSRPSLLLVLGHARGLLTSSVAIEVLSH